MGHGRLQAARKLGLAEVPCIVRDDLSGAQVKALRIADNKVSESEWDIELLLLELEEIEDFTGFEGDEFQIDEKVAKKEKPEMEFTEELFEEHNYIVLYFDNIVDWQTACDKLNIKQVKALDSREGFERVGIGRVVRGDGVIARIS